MAFENHPAQADVRILNALQGLVEVAPKRKKVAIVGFGTNSRHLAPWSDPDYEIWGMNQAYLHMGRRADRWFEIHRPEHTADMRAPDYTQWLKTCPIPVYMIATRPDVPNSVRFPLERVEEYFGISYHTSSVAYMIELAIMEGFEEIAVYGIDLVCDDAGQEYLVQKPCVEHWLGVASGRGISVRIPGESALLKGAFRYGYEQPAKLGIDLGYVEQLVNDNANQAKAALTQYATHNGAMQMAKHVYGLLEHAQRGSFITNGR